MPTETVKLKGRTVHRQEVWKESPDTVLTTNYYYIKPEALQPGFIPEWERVKQLRKEKEMEL